MRDLVLGRVNSFQSLGAVDGPGVRFVVFLQGCNLRCGFCHNPDTWDASLGKELSAKDVVLRAERYREYYGAHGGITVSGGEPLLQAEFVKEIFEGCKERGIDTCLDTSGSIMNDSVKDLLRVTDRVLLDVKFTKEEQYKSFVGCSMERPLAFLSYLDKLSIPTVIRQVTVPTLNSDEENLKRLLRLRSAYPCVEKIELLPFKKLCRAKYDNLSIPFPFDIYPEPTASLMNELISKIR